MSIKKYRRNSGTTALGCYARLRSVGPICGASFAQAEFIDKTLCIQPDPPAKPNRIKLSCRLTHFLVQKKLDHALQMPHIIAMKTAAVHSRIEPETKEMAEGILRKLGLSPTDAIRLFYTQITLRNGLPFPVSIPNEETAQAMEDSRKNRDLSTYSSTDELFKSWDE